MGRRYEVLMDADANVMLVACMVLALNTSKRHDDRDIVNIQFGWIGPEARAFDESWEPRG
jgi:hypothetical protein